MYKIVVNNNESNYLVNKVCVLPFPSDDKKKKKLAYLHVEEEYGDGKLRPKGLNPCSISSPTIQTRPQTT
jgi:hypothetical protein